MRSGIRRSVCVLVAVCALAVLAPGGLVEAAPARAGVGGLACKLLGTVGEGWWGKACSAALSVGGKLIGGAKKAAGALGKLAGNPLVQRGAGIAAIVAWVLGGARWTIGHMGSVIAHTTSPELTANWFTGVYLRVQALAVFFALLFVCAAGCEAVLRQETGVLARAIFAQLPLAALLTIVAAPLAMLLLAATDQLSAGFQAMAGQGATHFLTGKATWVAAGLTAADPFFAVIAGGLIVAAGGALWVEMLIREIAVYLVVAMLPLVFASMVWPARRVWAIRTVEVLIALILSKVAIVCVLALGGAALSHGGASSLSRLLGGLALLVLGAFSPWLLLRLIPIAEVASAAVGHIRGQLHSTAGIRTPEAALAAQATGRVAGRRGGSERTDGAAGTVGVQELLEQMHRRAQRAENGAAANGGSPEGTGGQQAPAAGIAAKLSSVAASDVTDGAAPRARATRAPVDGPAPAADRVDASASDADPLIGSDRPDPGRATTDELAEVDLPPPMPAPEDGHLLGDHDRDRPGDG